MPEVYRVRLTLRALNDIDDINDFISQTSRGNAARMIDRIFSAFESLEAFPHRTVVEGLSHLFEHPVRSLPVRPYVIYFFVVEPEKIVVIRHIRHGSRQSPDSLD